jgi:hypothetical protein
VFPAFINAFPAMEQADKHGFLQCFRLVDDPANYSEAGIGACSAPVYEIFAG